MYAGGVAGGVWKTTNGGASWTAEGDDLANLAVTTLALRPGSPNTILAGTGEGFFNIDRTRGGDLPVDGRRRGLDPDRMRAA